MLRHLPSAALLLTVFVSTARAAPPLPDDIDARAALQAAPAVLAAQAAVTAAAARQDGLAAGPYEFEVGTVAQRRNVQGEGNYTEWEGGISHRLRLPGKAALDRRLGALGSEAAQLGVADAYHRAAVQMLDLWFGWLGAAAALPAVEDYLGSLQRQRDAVVKRLSHGDAAQLDVELAETDLARAEASLARARSTEREAAALLAGNFPQLPVPTHLPELAPPTLPEQSAAELAELIVERSHEIGIACAEQQHALTRAERAGRDRIADPSLGLRTLRERGGDETAVGLTISVPIGGRYRRAEARAQAADAGAAAARLDAVRRQIGAHAQAVTARMRGAYAAWQASEKAAAAARAHAERARRGYALGETDLFTLLAALRSAGDARREETAARIAAHAAIARVQVDAHLLWAHHKNDQEDEDPVSQ